ncbi:MAG: TetR/AcrR family transcriptional regulator [Kibdelosporangium sp.]
MARPRSISDERILRALGEVISAQGPGFTVADVAAAAGISVGTVAQRFGSKHGLLKALSAAAIEQIEGQVMAAASAAPTPLDAVRAAVLGAYRDLDDPATAVNNLGQLASDLADPELRALLGKGYAVLENSLHPLLRAANLPAGLARLLVSLANGTAIDWSVRPRGRLLDRLAEDMDMVLKGWGER